ncbi:hypothetical protein [Microbacterium sp. NPDC056234]|uniref:hypothetical protein n=1 Tax=Microbacterium sp. NPDC056234 TaxID=3345757 RepID=UPI0035DE0AC2
MGMFTQGPEDKGAWAALPGEPAESDAVDVLPPAGIDALSVGLGGSVESIVFPVPPPSPEASDHSDGEPPTL